MVSNKQNTIPHTTPVLPDVIATLGSYIPTLVLKRLRENPQEPTEATDGYFPAAVLSADVSGFTALTERLAQQGPAGAEELSGMLNSLFDELINLITVMGGDVVTFAGDAILALWPATEEDISHATRRAAQCGLALQTLLSDEKKARLMQLAVRMGIGVGEIRMLYLGGMYGRWQWLISGPPLIQAAEAGTQARPGQVLLSYAAWELVQGYCEGYHALTAPALNEDVSVLPPVILAAVTYPVPPSIPESISISDAMEPAIRAYIPGAVLTRISAAQGTWLAELRRLTVLFISLPDLDDPTRSTAEIQQVIQTVQKAIYHYEGSFNKLSVDEKGVSVVAALGLPPLTHADDPVRGVQAALKIQAALHNMGMRVTIGVTTGRAFCGEVGNIHRCEYTILGDVVNLAARLMQAAARFADTLPSAILCDTATYQAARLRLNFERLPAITVKGKTEPVAIYTPLGEAEPQTRPQRAIIGRDHEREMIAGYLQQLLRGQSKQSGIADCVPQTEQMKREQRPPSPSNPVLIIEGEAGMGKSRLVHEVRRQADAMHIHLLEGAGHATEQSTPYYAWRSVFTLILGVDSEDDVEHQRQCIIQSLTASSPAMLDRLPLLNAILPVLEFPENETTEQMTTQMRADTTRMLLQNLVCWAVSLAPTVLVMEDIHWLDTASFKLLLSISKRLKSMLTIVTTRPVSQPLEASYSELLRSPRAQHLQLAALSLADTARLIAQHVNVRSVPPQLVEQIYERAQGNPFFTEELAYALCESGLLIVEDGQGLIAREEGRVHMLKLPDTIQGVITSRIDRLTPAQQLTLKVASVIGVTFPFRVLHDIYPIEMDRNELSTGLSELTGLGLVQNNSAATEPVYQFRHMITQQVIYDLMAFAQRRRLHRAIAEWYEQQMADRVDEFAPLLAQHFAHADDERAIYYYIQAGDQAFDVYANQEALTHYDRALNAFRAKPDHNQEIITPKLLIQLYLRRGRVLELYARYAEALENYHEMEAVGEQLQQPALKLAALMAQPTLYLRPIPSYDPPRARIILDEAYTLTRAFEDLKSEAYILWNLMLLYVFTVDDPQQAITYGEQSLRLARVINDHEQIAFTLNDLAMAYRASGQMHRSQDSLAQARDLWRELNNLPMLADNLSSTALGYFLMGEYDRTVICSADAGQITHSIGNVEGQATSRFIVGNVYLERGQPQNAITIMEQALDLGEQSNSIHILAGTRADLAWLYGTLGAIDQGIALAEQAVATAHNNILFHQWARAVLARLHLCNGSIVEAETVLAEQESSFRWDANNMLGGIYVPLAMGELAYARQDYSGAVRLMNQLIDYLHTHEIQSFMYEARYLKARALYALCQTEGAYTVLQTALAEAEALEARRVLWRILLAISACEQQAGNITQADKLRQQAREHIDYIAEHIGTDGLKASFLALPDVMQVLHVS